MRVLIIGGAGYIGSHVAREFLDAGHAVTVFDNLSSGAEENLFSEATFIKGDILNYQELVSALKGQDAVVHLAAFKAVGESMIKPEKYSVNNITGTLNILNAMCETGVRRIVFSSSAATYGEPEYLPIDEAHPTNPTSYYGFTKIEIERFLGWYDKLKSIRFGALRYFNAAGYDVKGRIKGLEREPANLIPRIMEVAIGWKPKIQVFGTDYDTRDGTCVRDYVHVNDLAVAHVKTMEYIDKNEKSVTFNLGTGEGITVLEILESARRVTGQAIPADMAPRRPGDPAKLYASSALAGKTIGWKPSHSDVDTLVRSTWEFYQRKDKEMKDKGRA
jgi:UDP-glucose 4-epimerase